MRLVRGACRLLALHTKHPGGRCQAQEPAADGPREGVRQHTVLDVDMSSFNRHVPRMARPSSVGHGVKFLNRVLSGRMFSKRLETDSFYPGATLRTCCELCAPAQRLAQAPAAPQVPWVCPTWPRPPAAAQR